MTSTLGKTLALSKSCERVPVCGFLLMDVIYCSRGSGARVLIRNPHGSCGTGALGYTYSKAHP
jgi:hypothetical protein